MIFVVLSWTDWIFVFVCNDVWKNHSHFLLLPYKSNTSIKRAVRACCHSKHDNSWALIASLIASLGSWIVQLHKVCLAIPAYLFPACGDSCSAIIGRIGATSTPLLTPVRAVVLRQLGGIRLDKLMLLMWSCIRGRRRHHHHWLRVSAIAIVPASHHSSSRWLLGRGACWNQGWSKRSRLDAVSLGHTTPTCRSELLLAPVHLLGDLCETKLAAIAHLPFFIVTIKQVFHIAANLVLRWRVLCWIIVVAAVWYHFLLGDTLLTRLRRRIVCLTGCRIVRCSSGHRAPTTRPDTPARLHALALDQQRRDQKAIGKASLVHLIHFLGREGLVRLVKLQSQHLVGG